MLNIDRNSWKDPEDCWNNKENYYKNRKNIKIHYLEIMK